MGWDDVGRDGTLRFEAIARFNLKGWYPCTQGTQRYHEGFLISHLLDFVFVFSKRKKEKKRDRKSTTKNEI